MQVTLRAPQHSNVGYIFGLIALFFCLTPWASWGTNQLDSQPWALIFCVLYLLGNLRTAKIPRIYFFMLIWTVFSLCIAVPASRSDSIQNARGIVSYLTIPVVLIFFSDFLKRYSFPIFTIVLVNYLWIFFGIIEAINPALNSWTSIMRTTENRGVTSLAPEPTFFAVYLIFSIWIILTATNYRPSKNLLIVILVNIFSILFLAKSSMGLLFLGPVLLVWYVGRFGFTKGLVVFLVLLTVLLASFSAASGAFIGLFEGTRIGELLHLVDRIGIWGVVLADASINVRLEHVVIPVHAFFETGFLPNGFNAFYEMSRSILHDYRGVFWYSNGNDKIMSWTGAYLFEMGFLGLISIIILLYSCWNGRLVRIVELICLLVLLVAAIPLAFSMVSILIVCLRQFGNNKTQASQGARNANFPISSRENALKRI